MLLHLIAVPREVILTKFWILLWFHTHLIKKDRVAPHVFNSFTHIKIFIFCLSLPHFFINLPITLMSIGTTTIKYFADMKALGPTKNKFIINDLKPGVSTRVVARKHSVSQTKVCQLAKTVKEYIPKPTVGRPGKISPKIRRLIICGITTGTIQTAVDVQKKLSRYFSVDVCFS